VPRSYYFKSDTLLLPGPETLLSGARLLVSINEVNLRQARLILRWVTVSRFNSRCQAFISVRNQPPRPTQPSIPLGSVNEYQLGWEGKGRYGSFRYRMNTGCAGKTVRYLTNVCHRPNSAPYRCVHDEVLHKSTFALRQQMLCNILLTTRLFVTGQTPKLELYPTTFYTHFCHHHPPHHRTTVEDSVHTHFCYLHAQHIFQTVIS